MQPDKASQMTKLAARIAAAQTSIFKVVFPNTTNHYKTLFGGEALKMMDEVAFIAATRFSRKTMVTVSSSKVDFTMPIPADTIIEVQGAITRVGRTSVDVQVNIYKEEMYEEGRVLAVQGLFTMVAVDENKEPVPVMEE